MEFEEAKKLIIQGYLELGFEIVTENEYEISLTHRNYNYKVTQDDSQNYVEFNNVRHIFQNVPSVCSMCSKDFREHVVYPTHSRGGLFRFLSRREKIIFGNPSSDEIYVEISNPSNN
jgi:hypothetical protein